MRFDNLQDLILNEGVKDKSLTIGNGAPNYTRDDIESVVSGSAELDGKFYRNALRKANWVTNKFVKHFDGKSFSSDTMSKYLKKLINQYNTKIKGGEELSDADAYSQVKNMTKLLASNSISNGSVVAYSDYDDADYDISADINTNLNNMGDLVDAQVAIKKVLANGAKNLKEIKSDPIVSSEDFELPTIKFALKVMSKGSNSMINKGDDGSYSINADFESEIEKIRKTISDDALEYDTEEIESGIEDLIGDSDAPETVDMRPDDEENLGFDVEPAGESEKPRWYPKKEKKWYE